MNPVQPKKGKFLQRLASENGVAIIIVDASAREVVAANNNSMCRVLMSSPEFVPRCAEYCGKAFDRAVEAGKTIEYECHAGLTCKAVPVTEAGTQFVAIVGRTFLKAENYRKATEKAISGEWQQFKPTVFFENILISGSTTGIDNAVKRLKEFKPKRSADVLQLEVPSAIPRSQPIPAEDLSKRIQKFQTETRQTPSTETQLIKPVRDKDDSSDIAAWRMLFGSIMKMEYRRACGAFLEFLGERFAIESLLWFDMKDEKFHSAIARGRLKGKTIRLGIAPDDPRMRDAVGKEQPFELYERPADEHAKPGKLLNIFPVTVGGEIRGAIGIEGVISDIATKRRIARAAQTVATQLEILRLRDEVSQRDWISRAVRKFNESLKQIDAEDFWTQVTQVSAELLQAERASLLVRQDNTDDLQTRAAIGAKINLFSASNVGNRVARATLDSGNPLIVADIRKAGIGLAPTEWSYRTSSFISYPILIGDRRVAVMNFTDKASGDAFGERDLELLQAITPQIAVAIDRTTLKHKAGEFEQLSVTDVLTGLLNRRYLQERLAEELNRSKRYRFPMSLLMLDVDKFKAYNDNYGHPAGDGALKIVANILKENLRGADVAARYGGEEFAVLLPQTSIEEASQIAERIRRQIERTDFPHRGVTVSIGIAQTTAEVNSPDDLIWAADRALYQAKDRGRNNVRIFEGDGDSLGNNVH
jgi:diguanylate cyclase (GGDEF)-like protein